MIKVGIAGIGFMGWIHWLAYQKVAGIEVVAIATPEPERRAGDWRSIKGNFGPQGEIVDLTGVRTYPSLAEMVNDQELDLIDICLPPAMHLEGVVTSAKAGKHVFCEKPLCLDLASCDSAKNACAQAGRMLYVGHVLPFFNEFQFIREEVKSRRLGKLRGGSFKRVISDPVWLPHFYDPKIVGGPLFDLHVHDAHFIRLLFGMPKSVCCAGRRRGETVEYCHSLFRFDDPDIVVASTMGVIQQQGRPFTHGFEIHFERATVHFEFAALAEPNSPETCRLKVFYEDGTVNFPDLGDGDPIRAFEREICEVASALSEQQPSAILDGSLARDAIEICEIQLRELMR